jgi:hypothetical protein
LGEFFKSILLHGMENYRNIQLNVFYPKLFSF